MLFDVLGLGCRNTFRAFLALEETLKDKVGTRLDGLAITTSLEELTTERTAAQVVDLLHAFEHGVALGTESLD